MIGVDRFSTAPQVDGQRLFVVLGAIASSFKTRPSYEWKMSPCDKRLADFLRLN